MQVKKVISDLFNLCPDAKSCTQVATEEIEKIIKSLGLQKKRSMMLQRFSQEYLDGSWTHVTQLHGVGKYAILSSFCFCVCLCVCVFAPSVIVYLGNAVSISFPSVDTDSLSIQVRSRCICYILYGKVGASEAHRSHAKSLLGIPPQKTLDEFG